MKLMIVESPAKAKTIEKYLSAIDPEGNVVVRASIGHVRDLPKNNKKAIDIEGGFIPHYEISEGKEKVISELKALANKADSVMLATDPDREGEAIAWHLKELLDDSASKKKSAGSSDTPHPRPLPMRGEGAPRAGSKFSRVTFHEITKDAVAEAIAHPREIDENLRQAQEARRVLDRLVGYDLSGLIWKKVRYGLSAGRVQSPALRILMEREREIRAFVPEEYFVIEAKTKTPRQNPLTVGCTEEPRDRTRAERIVAVVEKEGLTVATVTETEMKRAARAPFTTSTLQQCASSRLGFSPSNTMRIAQKLYEAGLITYMRTDSVNLSPASRQAVNAVVIKKYGAEYAEEHTFKNASKNAQEAHEAIRPSNPSKATAGATPEQKKLYELIWARTISSQMSDARFLKTRIVAKTPHDDLPDFTANGSRILFDGWLKVDTEARSDDVELPKVNEGDALAIEEVLMQDKWTTPPDRYSEAGLVKELEKRGIGRPSTYASIMSTLQDRGYVTKESRSLRPTDVGDVVSTFLEDNFPTYISDTFTAEMEDELDEIAEGKREYTKTLADFYTPFHNEVKLKDTASKITDLGPAPMEFPCPECGGSMVFKLSRTGKFMSCARFPDCNGARSDTGDIISKEPAKSIGNDPATGLPVFVLTGRFGPFVQIGGEMAKPEEKEKAAATETPAGADASGAKPKKKRAAKKAPKVKLHRASVPKGKDPATVTLEDALVYLSLPRTLGEHPITGKVIQANIGRFGPYIVHNGDFRSLKTDDPYTIPLPRALEILSQEKKKRGFVKKAKKAE